MTEIRRSYCGLCHPRCGTLLHIEDGRVVKVTGDPDHPVTRGAICERGKLMPDHVHHPARPRRPDVSAARPFIQLRQSRLSELRHGFLPDAVVFIKIQFRLIGQQSRQPFARGSVSHPPQTPGRRSPDIG